MLRSPLSRKPKPKNFDGVIEAVRYTADGQLALARAYLRRGPTFSDCVLLTRDELVERLKAGQRFVLGRRKPYLASTFEVGPTVSLERANGKEVLYAGTAAGEGDHLKDAPLF